MISGVDYVFYSDTPPLEVEGRFRNAILSVWSNPIIEEDREKSELTLYFVKDSLMDKHTEENGFVLDDNKEGAFEFIVREFGYFQCDATVREIIFPEDPIPTMVHRAIIAFHNCWEYTVVLPSTISKSKFSKKIYYALKESLGK